MTQDSSLTSHSTPLPSSINNTVDIAIIGGGIAGLWTLSRLKKLGYQAILLEADSLGCMQTGASQGIIHGGTKYALTGKLTHSSQAISQMPARWKECLKGTGEIDLSKATVLSDYQYLWSNKSIASKLTGFFASKVMRSRMQPITNKKHIAPFNHQDFKGDLYQLDEPVLDTFSVINTIYRQYKACIFNYNVTSISKEKNNYTLNCTNSVLPINTKTIILTAGSGSEHLLKSLKSTTRKMQRRPLFMPMLKSNNLPHIYAHCLGVSALPKLTITSHKLNKDTVWYHGGDIAEKGIHRNINEQVLAAKNELNQLLPWVDFSNCAWSALHIDRAEPANINGGRPSDPYVSIDDKIITAWPVKLAMTPLMVDKVIESLSKMGIERNSQAVQTKSLSTAKISPLPWENVTQWIN